MECNDCKRTDIKCCNTCRIYGETCDVVHLCGKDCPEYKARIKTNDDHINSMSAEEKAEWLFEHDRITAEKGRLSKEELLQWLKSEAKG